MKTLDFAAAKIKHRTWQINVRGFLDGRESLTESQAMSHEECDLGKWLYAEGLQKYGTIQKMKDLEKVHVELHACIKRIIDMKNAGNTSGAEQEYARLEEASDRIVSLLDSLQATIE